MTKEARNPKLALARTRMSRRRARMSQTCYPERIEITQPRHLRYSVNRFLADLFTTSESGSGRELRAFFLKGGQVVRFVVGLAVLPHPPDDALPFVGQFPNRFVMVHLFAELLIQKRRPSRELDGRISKFMPALPQKFRTAPADVNPILGFAALFGHWGDAGIATDLQGTGEAAAIGSQGSQQPRSQHRASAGQAVENGCIRMGGEKLGNLSIILVDKGAQRCQLCCQGLDGQAVSVEQGGILCQSHGLADPFQASGDQLLGTAVSHISGIRNIFSPSPLPSHSERGGTKDLVATTRRIPRFRMRCRKCSLSLRERVGVRGSGPWKMKNHRKVCNCLPDFGFLP